MFHIFYLADYSKVSTFFWDTRYSVLPQFYITWIVLYNSILFASHMYIHYAFKILFGFFFFSNINVFDLLPAEFYDFPLHV